jgi:hypothetical protein
VTAATTAAPKRWAIVALAVIGVGLIAAPFAFKMFDRAPLGATMITEFKPYMTEQRLDGFARDIRQIDGGVQEGNTKVRTSLTKNSTNFDREYPAFASFQKQWDSKIEPDMSSLIESIASNRSNYDAVAALPSFKLFPWFFVIPGVILLGLAILGLARPDAWPTIRYVALALGVGLILAPVVFQMFTRAPKGAKMMNAFETVETRERVQTIQGYFSSIAVGQGDVRLKFVPALRKQGLTDQQIAERFPAITTLNEQWNFILGDLTPMLGAMSDNVDNYEAVKSLPPFGLFPWFFLAPGLLIAVLAFSSLTRDARRTSTSPSTRPKTQGAA